MVQVCKPAASVDIAQPITELDLYVGAVVTILQRTFELLEADEFTMQASSARSRSLSAFGCCSAVVHRRETD